MPIIPGYQPGEELPRLGIDRNDGEMPGYGPDGSTYLRYAWVAPWLR